MRPFLALLCAGLCLAQPRQLAAQQPPADDDRVRVFIDCQWECDQDFLRTAITGVCYMRDRADAQVHVLVTAETTGGGGRHYTLNFIGLRRFEGVSDTLTYTSSSDDSSDLRRRGLTRTIAMGLVPFVARTSWANRVTVTVPAAETESGAPAGTAPVHDPWKFWTFRIGTNGFANGESNYQYYSINGSVSANRVTEAWKVNLGFNGNYRETKFQYEILGEEIETMSLTRSYGFSSLLVRSLGSKLSAGARANVSTSTFGNTSLAVSVAPAVEYNFYPYTESTRRQLLLRYSAGVRYSDYREVTIYDEVEETRPTHNLALEYATTQPWGRVYLSADGAQYLHDRSKYNAGVSGSTEVRLFKGFSLNFSGDYRHVRDQLSLPARDLTEEEILLRQRQLATGYTYYFSAGVGYRFGSIFNSIVNPRFSGAGGGMFFM